MTSHEIFLTCPEAGQSKQPTRLLPNCPVLPRQAKIPKRLPAVNAVLRLPQARSRRSASGTFATEPNVVYFWSVRKRDCELWNCRISPDAGGHMKSNATIFMLLSVLGSSLSPATLRAQAPPPAAAQGQAAQPPATDTVAPDIPGVVAGGTRVQVIKEGFQGTEGPIALPDGTLIFTETQVSRLTRIDQDGNTSTFLENTNGSNGLAFDAKGRLISVQTTPGQTRIGVIYPKGSEAVLADNYEGKPFGRPNDLVVDKKGGVYFTDPGVTAPPNAPPPSTPPLPAAVYYTPPGGKAIRVADGITRPNGILLSTDEKILYVNNTSGEYLLAFDIQPDGTVRNRRDFAKD